MRFRRSFRIFQRLSLLVAPCGILNKNPTTAKGYILFRDCVADFQWKMSMNYVLEYFDWEIPVREAHVCLSMRREIIYYFMRTFHHVKSLALGNGCFLFTDDSILQT